MNTYKIEYKWRVLDQGQAHRAWYHTFSLVQAQSLEEALNEFKSRDWKVEYEIKEYNM